MNTNGYFPLQRSLLATDFWRTQSRTSPTAALVELFALARYGQRATTVLMGRRRIRVFRGEIVASLRFLADRWKWSVGRVRYFLSKLHDQGVLHLSTRQRITVITLLKPARPLGPADLDPAAPGIDPGPAATAITSACARVWPLLVSILSTMGSRVRLWVRPLF